MQELQVQPVGPGELRPSVLLHPLGHFLKELLRFGAAAQAVAGDRQAEYAPVEAKAAMSTDARLQLLDRALPIVLAIEQFAQDTAVLGVLWFAGRELQRDLHGPRQVGQGAGSQLAGDDDPEV